MKPMETLFAAFFTLSAPACSMPDAADSPLVVTSLRFAPSAFDSFARNTEIRYSLSAPVDVSVEIIRASAAHERVKTLFANLPESKGLHAHTWLGDTEEGRFAPAGEYRGVVRAGSRRFETTVRIFHF
ncbi:MAG TPA: hypothetical protein VF889_06615 [Bacteroidota bacterium]